MRTSPNRTSTPTLGTMRLGFVVSALLAATAHAENASPKFVMTAYTNGVGGQELVTGEYSTALAIIGQTPRKWSVYDPLTASANLCVAYTMTKQWESARKACDEAVKEAKYEKLRAPMWTYASRVKQNSYIALAYSNRAVLNWLSNDTVSAEQDLSSAEDYAPKADFVARNRAALRSSSGALAQAVVAPQG